VRAHLPDAAEETRGAFELPALGVSVTLRVEGGVTVADAMGRRGIALDTLGVALGDGAGEATIRAGDGVAYRDVIAAHDACVSAGFGSVSVLGR